VAHKALCAQPPPKCHHEVCGPLVGNRAIPLAERAWALLPQIHQRGLKVCFEGYLLSHLLDSINITRRQARKTITASVPGGARARSWLRGLACPPSGVLLSATKRKDRAATSIYAVTTATKLGDEPSLQQQFAMVAGAVIAC
jgi:hypothetical protein